VACGHFSESAVKSTEALNSRIETVLAARREFDLLDGTTTLAKADVIELDYSELLTIHAPRVELARVLQSELRLRTEIDAWLDGEMQPALRERHNELSAALEAARAKIRAALEALGYKPFQASTIEPCKWQPGWIEAFPSVRALRNEILTASDGHESRSENHRAAQETTRLLERLRDDAIAAANVTV
jgi:hypothetical protein